MKFGITERGDAALDLSWVKKMCPGNIIISKELTPNLASVLLDNASRIIFHMTCTGYGRTVIEPNVPAPEETKSAVCGLIAAGFPVSHIVLRVDPIIPTAKGIARAKHILDLFRETGIKRVRYSYLDMYPHVIKRFGQAGYPVPYSSFTAPPEMQDAAEKMLKGFQNVYELEACAEKTPNQLGCLSQKDYDILGLPFSPKENEFAKQRPMCLCCADKTELLTSKTQCAHGCIYCYWH